MIINKTIGVLARANKHCLSLGILIALPFANQAYAGQVAPGGEFVLYPDPTKVPETWDVAGGMLTVLPDAQSLGIRATAGATLNIDGASIHSPGTATPLSSGGVYLTGGSAATINNSDIVSDGSFGMVVTNDLGNVGAGSTATVTGGSITGMGAGVHLVGTSTLSLTGVSVIGHADGAANHDFKEGIGLTVVGDASAMVRQSSLFGDEHGVVMSSLDGGLAPDLVNPVLVLDGSTVAGGTGSAIVVKDIYGTKPTHASIEVNNGSTLTGGNGVILEVVDNSGVDFSVSNSHLIGNVVVEAGSTADISLSNSASLTGHLDNVSSLAINSGSSWNMVGDNTLAVLNLDGGAVNFGSASGFDRSRIGGFHRLDLGTLAGEGTFRMGVNLAAGLGDFLNVAGAATGNHALDIANTGVDPIGGERDLQVVHTGSGDANFGAIGGQVDVGTFVYDLEEREDGIGGKDWFLVQRPGDILTPGAKSVIALFSAAPTVWYGEMTTLRSRMGELRNGNQEGGFWMRAYGNKQNLSVAGQINYDQNQQGISFGADAPLPTQNGQWLVGLMGGYSNSRLNMKGGTSGGVDSFYAGAYSTWLQDDGFYIDALIKANRFQSRTDVVMSDGYKAKGTFDNVGIGASVEAGKHIKLQDNWFVEPYAQLSALWVSGDTIHLDNGMKGSTGKTDSLLGKVGTHVGRRFPLDQGGFVQPYAKLAIAQEFAKNNEVKVNNNRFRNDISGGRGEIGAGLSAQLTDVLQVSAEFDYSKGDNIEQPWGMNVGLRYNF